MIIVYIICHAMDIDISWALSGFSAGEELRLHDKWAGSCVPSGGAVVNPDPTGRRNGQGGSFLCLSTVR